MTGINNWACLFLVALRLVIGWHFLVEGWSKIESHRRGKSAANTPWTGAGFFREGYGPAAEISRNALNLDDRELLAKLTLVAGRIPPAVEQEWETYLNSFSKHYALTEQQTEAAKAKWSSARDELLAWLRGDTPSTVKRNLQWGLVELKSTVPQRLEEYQKQVRAIADVYERRLPAFNKDVEKSRLRTLKAEAAKTLADLGADLDERTAAMKASLSSVLTDEQKKSEPMPEASPPAGRIALADRAVMWTHFILGACLLLGLFTRVVSLLLAGFLLHVTLIAPALPYAPTPPGAVGHYLYINLYVIEMVALLALACMPTGRWFGIDAMFRKRQHVRSITRKHAFAR